MKSSDCIVIGGGIIGMLTARELALNGLQVRLFERGRVGQECSWAGGGILSSLYPWRASAALSEMSRWSQSYYPELIESLLGETGIDPEWQLSGLLVLENHEQKEAMAWAQKNNVSIEYINTNRLADLEPELKEYVDNAIWLPDVAQIRNPRLIAAVKKNILKLGIDLIEHTEVTGLNIKNEKLQAIESSAGLYTAAYTVIACGAWSRQLIRQLPVFPVRGQMLCLKTAPGYLQHILLRSGVYLIPRKDGHLLLGSTLEEVGYNKETTQAARHHLRHVAEAILPALNCLEVIHQWSGLRPGTRDGNPFICAYPGIEGLFLNTGHHRYGILLAPASARLLTDIILNRQSFIAADMFQYRV